MDALQLSNFPVSSLPDRYKIGKSQLYQRLRQLEIKTHVISGRAYVTQEQLELLDKFNTEILLNGSGKAFIKNLATNSLTELEEVLSDELQVGGLDFIQPLLILEEFEKRQWLITSRQLAFLTNSTPSRFYGKSTYLYRGFVLRRVPDSTREATWKVDKISTI